VATATTAAKNAMASFAIGRNDIRRGEHERLPAPSLTFFCERKWRV